jgi:hypothetical protein
MGKPMRFSVEAYYDNSITSEDGRKKLKGCALMLKSLGEFDEAGIKAIMLRRDIPAIVEVRIVEPGAIPSA